MGKKKGRRKRAAWSSFDPCRRAWLAHALPGAQSWHPARSYQAAKHRQAQPNHKGDEANPGSRRSGTSRTPRRAQGAAQIATNGANRAGSANDHQHQHGQQRERPDEAAGQSGRPQASDACRPGSQPAAQKVGDNPDKDCPAIIKGSVAASPPDGQANGSAQRAQDCQDRDDGQKACPDWPPTDPIGEATPARAAWPRCFRGCGCCASRGRSARGLLRGIGGAWLLRCILPTTKLLLPTKLLLWIA